MKVISRSLKCTSAPEVRNICRKRKLALKVVREMKLNKAFYIVSDEIERMTNRNKK